MAVRILQTITRTHGTYVAGTVRSDLTLAQEVDLVAIEAARYVDPTRDATISLPVVVDRNGHMVGRQMPDGSVDAIPLALAASRALTGADNGKTIDCTAAGLTITVPAGLPPGFTCLVIPNGTTTFASSGGALLNGATSNVPRAAASNATVSIVARSNPDSYLVTGV